MSITEELRNYADLVAEMEPTIGGNLKAIADGIDDEYKSRMRHAKHNVRRRLCTDLRWVVTMLEHKCNRREIRDALED